MRGWKMHLDGELWGARSLVQPNTGHEAIKRLADADRLAGVVTQNVDGLHLVSGLDDGQLAELHGNVRKSLCFDCERVWDTETVLSWVEAGELDPNCPDCGGMVKTATVMFGEILPQEEMEKAMEFLAVRGRHPRGRIHSVRVTRVRHRDVRRPPLASDRDHQSRGHRGRRTSRGQARRGHRRGPSRIGGRCPRRIIGPPTTGEHRYLAGMDIRPLTLADAPEVVGPDESL